MVMVMVMMMINSVEMGRCMLRNGVKEMKSSKYWRE